MQKERKNSTEICDKRKPSAVTPRDVCTLEGNFSACRKVHFAQTMFLKHFSDLPHAFKHGKFCFKKSRFLPSLAKWQELAKLSAHSRIASEQQLPLQKKWAIRVISSA